MRRSRKRIGWKGALGAIALGVVVGACGDDESLGPNPEDADFAAALNVDLSQMTRLPSGVYIQDLSVGAGDTAQAADSISVDYEGWLANGDKFDSSLDRGTPFEFVVGVGDVIPGWDLGIPGMIEGGLRKLVIPAAHAYGPRGSGPIPGNAVLVFDVELHEVYPDSLSG